MGYGPRLSVMLSLDTDNNAGACPRLLLTSPELQWGQGEVLEASFQVLSGLMGVPSRWLLRWWPPGTNASSAQKSTPLVVSNSFPFLLDRLS